MTTICLGEAARFINGAAFKPTDWGKNGLPIIRIQNLTGTGERFNYTTRQVKPDLIVEPGDLLVSWSATLDVYRWNGVRGVLNQHIFKVLPASNVDPDYLFYALKSVISELSAKTHGSTMKHVVRGDFESTRVLMPELAEQRRIVDILSRAEGIVRLRREAQKKAAEIIPALFVDMFGDPATNPKGWSVSNLDSVAQIISGVTKGRRLEPSEMVELPYMRVANVKDGYLELSDIKTIAVRPHEVEKYCLLPGDLLMTEGGDPDKLGRAAIWSGELENCLHQNHIFKVRPHRDRLLPEYLRELVGSHYGKAYFLQVAKKTTGIATINRTQLGKFPVLIPPLEHQSEFARQFLAVRSIQFQQNAAMQKAEATFSGLLSRVMQRV